MLSSSQVKQIWDFLRQVQLRTRGPERGSRYSLGSPRLQLISSGTIPCGQREVSDQLSLMSSRNVSNPAGASLDELSRHTRKTKTKLQFHFWYTVSMPQRQNPMNAVIFISRPNPFVSGFTHQNSSLPEWCRLSLINCIHNGLG